MTEWADSLWAEASFDHEAAARQRAIHVASAELGSIMPFFLMSKSPAEYQHRRMMAASRLVAIAMRTGLSPDDIAALADGQMKLYFEAISKEALPEGVDPLMNIDQATHPMGSGPEKPDEHDQGPDFSHSYAEVPMGTPGGPPPQVTAPVYQPPQQVSEVTASRRHAQGMDPSASLPAGTGGSPPITPDGLPPGGSMPSPQSSPTAMPGSGAGDVNLSPQDPYNIQVSSVARSVMASNPQLPETEARRVARKVVAGYLRPTADLNDSVINDAYGTGNRSTPQDSLGGGGAGELMHSLMPEMGGGGGAGAAGEGAEVAELAAL